MVVKKMKEKCKDAARKRREKERAEFLELSKLLPLPASTTSQLDKASVIRLTSSYLRMRSAFPEGLGTNWGADRHQPRPPQQQQPIKELGSLLLQTLDGFVFALHSDGKIMYISETASVHLGLPQNDLTGSSVFEYVEPADRAELAETLALSEADRLELELHDQTKDTCELARSFCMRMKCILPKRNAGLVAAGFKAIHCNGYLKLRRKSSHLAADTLDLWESYALVAVGHSLLPTATTELKLTAGSFMFRANLDLELFHTETPMLQLLGYEQADMIGHTLYQFLHPTDCRALEKAHRSLLDKGQAVTRYLRLIRKAGGSLWVQSYATLVSNPRNLPKPYHIVAVCFVLAAGHLDQSRLLYQRSRRLDAAGGADGAQQAPARKPPDELSLKRSAKAREPQSKRIRKSRLQVEQVEAPPEQHQPAHRCSCSLLAAPSQPVPALATIGSSRRPSDDTCSVASSVAGSLHLSSASSTSSSCSSSSSSAARLAYPGAFNGPPGGDTGYERPPMQDYPSELAKGVQQSALSCAPADQMLTGVEIIGWPESAGHHQHQMVECSAQVYADDGLQNWGSLSHDCADLSAHHQPYYSCPQVDQLRHFSADSMEAPYLTYAASESPVTFYQQQQRPYQPPPLAPPPPTSTSTTTTMMSYAAQCHGFKPSQVLL